VFTAAGNAVKTYRYLRIALVALVGAIGASVAVEWWKTGGTATGRCLQTSISAYYYTPAQAVFVSSVVAIGACLVVLKGNTAGEDILLNVAGMLAVVVAMVPTPNPGTCYSVRVNTGEKSANVANNLAALLILGLLCLLLATVMVSAQREWDRHTVAGIALAAAILAVAAFFFVWHRQFFLDTAHYTAAIAMFVCIGAVVASNAGRVGDYTNRYAVVAWLMAVSTVVVVVGRLTFDWSHSVLVIEACLIGLFGSFWVLQTQELWSSVTPTVSVPAPRRPQQDARKVPTPVGR
jgi:hypothetical protein